LWLHSLKVAQLLRSAACLHTNQFRSYLNHLVFCNVLSNSLLSNDLSLKGIVSGGVVFCIATTLRTEGFGVRALAAASVYYILQKSTPSLEPTQPPIQWVSYVLASGVKRPGREIDHLSPSSVAVNNEWNCTSAPTFCFHGLGRDDFTLSTLPLEAVKVKDFFCGFLQYCWQP